MALWSREMDTFLEERVLWVLLLFLPQFSFFMSDSVLLKTRHLWLDPQRNLGMVTFSIAMPIFEYSNIRGGIATMS